MDADSVIDGGAEEIEQRDRRDSISAGAATVIGREVEREEHPVGALSLALLFGIVLAAVWLAVYFGVFAARG